MITRKEFAERVSRRGWVYVLENTDPDAVEDAVLGEALQDAQDAFFALLRVAPSEADADDDLDEDLVVDDDAEDDYFYRPKRLEDREVADLTELFDED